MSKYEMTASQRASWVARVAPLFAPDGNCTSLAKKGEFPEYRDKGHKTAAGYIGEFRDGKARGLTHFFGEPVRLGRLATALGTTVAHLEAIWREVRAEEAVTANTLWLPGFEDWGPVDFDEGFVRPPIESTPSRSSDRVRGHLLSVLQHGVAVVGPHGSGVTTLLRRFASWAAEDGWRITWGLAGGLPSGRSTLLVLDGPDCGDLAALAAWRKDPGHGLLHGRPAPEASYEFSHRLRPVDEAWLEQLLEVVVRGAPRGEAKRVRGLRADRLRGLLATLPRPTPEAAGCLLRAAVDGEVPDLASGNQNLVVAAARRRLVGRHLKEHLPVLARGDWVRQAYLGWVASSGGAVEEPIASAVLEQVRALVADLRLSRAEREALEAVLPLASGEGGVEALREADVVRAEPNGDRFRLEELLALSVAAEVAADPALLRTALLDQRRALLRAVASADGGPAALAAALVRLDGPGLATATADLADDEDWLSQVAWDPQLVARFVGLLVARGAFDRAFSVPKGVWVADDDGAAREDTPPMPALWRILGAIEALPPIAAVRVALDCFADELRVPRREVSDDILSLCLALGAPTAAIRAGGTAWEALDEELFPPAGWIHEVAGTVDGLAFLVDPTQSPVAPRIMKIPQRVPGPRGKADDTEPLQVWLGLLARLFKDAPERAVAAVAGILRDAASRIANLPESERTTEWFNRQTQLVRLEFAAAAAATQLAGRHRRGLRDAMRAAMGPWEVEAIDGFTDAREPGRFRLSSERGYALHHVLAFCYDEGERVGFLRTADGHLSPFWAALLRSGIPFEEALRLHQDVASGALPAREGRGAPLDRMLDVRDGESEAAARQRMTANVYLTLVEESGPEDLARLPGFGIAKATWSDELIEHYIRRPNVRQYLWRLVDDLDEKSVLWRLVATAVDLKGSNSREADAVREAESVAAAVRLVGGADLAPERWNRLANAALLAGIRPADQRCLLAVRCLREVDEPLLVNVLGELAADDPSWVRGWLRDRLADAPDLVDRAALSGIWVSAGVGVTTLRDALAALPAGRPKGDGIVRALVQLGHDGYAEWLSDDDARDAALGTLATSSDWQERLEPVLAAQQHVPAPAVLAHLLRQPGGVGLDVLDAASRGWPVDQQRRLWEAVAAVAGRREQRADVWRRLARCR